MCTSRDWHPLDKVLQETVDQALPCVPGARAGDYVPGVRQDCQFHKRLSKARRDFRSDSP